MKLKAVLRANAVREAEKSDIKEPVEALDGRVLPIDNLMTRAVYIQDASSDFKLAKVTLSNVRYRNGELCFVTDEGSQRHTYPMSRLAVSQLCSKVGVPAAYVQKCEENGRVGLAEKNVNSWIDTYEKDLFIREYSGRIRGVLSSKYSVCDAPDILSVLRDEVDLTKFKVKGSFLNEERLHLRLVGKEMLPIDGEDLFPAIFVDSSDVGRNMLTVQFGIYKLVCTNGMIVSRGSGVMFQQKHVGIDRREFREGLAASLRRVDVLCENAVSMVRHAKSKKIDLGKIDEGFIDQIRGTTKLSIESANKVADFIRHKYGESRWGYANALTEVAQEFTLDRRLELERIAGNMIAAA